MKHFKLTFIALFAIIISCFAQQKTTDKAIIKTPTMQCEQCKSKIEKALFKQDGITAYKVDLKKKTTTVSWITDRTNIENIKTMIANAGYNADDVLADETAYKRLPACCKKPDVVPAKKP